MKRSRKIHYKNTSNLRQKYRREKSIFSTEQWISDRNYDGKWVVGNQFVGEKNPMDSDEKYDGIRPSEPPSDRLTLSAHTAGVSDGFSRRKIRRKPTPVGPQFAKKFFINFVGLSDGKSRRKIRRKVQKNLKFFFGECEKTSRKYNFFLFSKVGFEIQEGNFFFKSFNTEEEVLRNVIRMY